MVGHTGDVDAAVRAIETVDGCLRRVLAAVLEGGGACIVTADHGNAEYMREPDGAPNTAHTTNPVPLIVTADGVELRSGGILADVSPTALDLLGIAQPDGDDRPDAAGLAGTSAHPLRALGACGRTGTGAVSSSEPRTRLICVRAICGKPRPDRRPSARRPTCSPPAKSGAQPRASFVIAAWFDPEALGPPHFGVQVLPRVLSSENLTRGD